MNPPAEVSTSLKTYQHFTLEKAYLREDFFWAFTPAAGDFIRFRFFQPLRLERLVLPGEGDRLNTSLEASACISGSLDTPSITPEGIICPHHPLTPPCPSFLIESTPHSNINYLCED